MLRVDVKGWPVVQIRCVITPAATPEDGGLELSQRVILEHYDFGDNCVGVLPRNIGERGRGSD